MCGTGGHNNVGSHLWCSLRLGIDKALLSLIEDTPMVKVTEQPAKRRSRNHCQWIYGDRDGLIGDANKFNFENYCEEYPLTTDKEILLGTNDYRDFYLTTFIKERLAQSISTVTFALCVAGTEKKALEFIRNNWAGYNMFSNGSGRVIIDTKDAIVEVEPSSNTINFRFHCTFDKADDLTTLVLANFDEVSVYVSWIYHADMSSITVPVDQTLLPVDEMYPFLNGETLDNYYRRFMESRANILILIGPPGTGKTSFIRGALVASQASAMVTYDQRILSEDRLFATFIESSSSTLVIEDADLFLSSRVDGNEMMHKFLNVGDGLVTISGKKLIFSTNLPSINDIDEALLRPGRCFDVLHFGELDKAEATKLVERLGDKYTLNSDKSRYTIAEIFTGFSNNEHTSSSRKFGF